ncbi:MAG: TauD/TfdA family dioxygenase [Acidiferrobacterales bacterium]
MNKSIQPPDSSHDGRPARPCPFLLDDEQAYRRWRDWKLEGYPASADDLIVEVGDPRALTRAEELELKRVCAKTNMAIYASRLDAEEDRSIPRMLGERLGLIRLDANSLADDDGISSLQVVPGKSGRGYIPYSNRRLLWHTDGYYNPPAQAIEGMVLHCVRPAATGGENALLDHEIAYILMRDAAPHYVRALMAYDAMTIPANTEGGSEQRPAQSGPVFAVSSRSASLLMRYTSRTRSIVWKQDADTLAAVQFLEQLLEDGSPHVFCHRLASGQGLLCNNVLHNRSGFTDCAEQSKSRLLYRARFFDRVAGTELDTIYC